MVGILLTPPHCFTAPAQKSSLSQKSQHSFIPSSSFSALHSAKVNGVGSNGAVKHFPPASIAQSVPRPAAKPIVKMSSPNLFGLLLPFQSKTPARQLILLDKAVPSLNFNPVLFTSNEHFLS